MVLFFFNLVAHKILPRVLFSFLFLISLLHSTITSGLSPMGNIARNVYCVTFHISVLMRHQLEFAFLFLYFCCNGDLYVIASLAAFFVIGTAGGIMILLSIQVETMDASLYSPALERSSLLGQFLEMKPSTSAQPLTWLELHCQ